MENFNQPANSPQFAPAPAPKSKKWVWIILAVIVVAVLLFGSWLYWKKQFIANAPKCGGIAGLSCPTGYECKGMGKYPDAQGYCVESKK